MRGSGLPCGKGATAPIPGPRATCLTQEPLRVGDRVSLSSDGTLNPSGVRFGSSEIYNIGTHFPLLLKFFSSNPGRKEGRGVLGGLRACFSKPQLLAQLCPICLSCEKGHL